MGSVSSNTLALVKLRIENESSHFNGHEIRRPFSSYSTTILRANIVRFNHTRDAPPRGGRSRTKDTGLTRSQHCPTLLSTLALCQALAHWRQRAYSNRVVGHRGPDRGLGGRQDYERWRLRSRHGHPSGNRGSGRWRLAARIARDPRRWIDRDDSGRDRRRCFPDMAEPTSQARLKAGATLYFCAVGPAAFTSGGASKFSKFFAKRSRNSAAALS